MIHAHRLDGVVLLGSCDKVVPGLMMAAARLEMPPSCCPAVPCWVVRSLTAEAPT